MIIIKRQGMNAMDYRRTLPFYNAYPQYASWNQLDEDRVAQDLEYLQQMYPTYAKRYQVRINEMLNRMDYDGSMIYDQYPDRWQLERFIDSIVTSIRNEETAGMQEQEKAQDEAKWPWVRELVTVLVYYEILRRRNKRKNYYIF